MTAASIWVHPYHCPDCEYEWCAGRRGEGTRDCWLCGKPGREGKIRALPYAQSATYRQADADATA